VLPETVTVFGRQAKAVVRRIGGPARLWLLAITAAAAVFCAGVIATPEVEQAGHAAGGWMRLAYRPACHQDPARCFDLGSGSLAVCARCTGLYTGGFAALLLTTIFGRSWRPRPRWLLIAIAVNVVDFALGLVGLPSLPNLPRFLIALPAGFLCGLFLVDAVVEMVEGRRDGTESAG
jgi:uncharacterized membrane protein